MGIVVGELGQCNDTVVVIYVRAQGAEGAAVVARETVAQALEVYFV